MVTTEQVLALNPCYPRDRIEELMRLDPYEALCSVPHADARWVLVRLMPVDARVAWARACARRATEYAADAASARAADAAAAWAERAAESAEHHIAVRHALLLLGVSHSG